MLVWLPLENLEERYTKDWARHFPQEFDRAQVDYLTVEGTPLTSKVEVGSVLDAYSTNHWKMTQLAALIQLLRNGIVTTDDTLLFADLWFPGLEALRYISDLGGAKPKITGILHAGTWDDHDFLVRSGARPWAHGIEESWLQMYDKVFLGSQFHKDLILCSHNVNPDKLIVTGLPFYPEDFTLSRAEIKKEDNYIIFPNRLDPEKKPQEYLALMELLGVEGYEVRGLCTHGHFATKQGYYDELAKASIALSFSEQETFGYAMQEATALGCIPLVPDRLSYRELYAPELCYHTFADLLDILRSCLKTEAVLTYYRKIAQKTAQQQKTMGAEAIGHMLQELPHYGT